MNSMRRKETTILGVFKPPLQMLYARAALASDTLRVKVVTRTMFLGCEVMGIDTTVLQALDLSPRSSPILLRLRDFAASHDLGILGPFLHSAQLH